MLNRKITSSNAIDGCIQKTDVFSLSAETLYKELFFLLQDEINALSKILSQQVELSETRCALLLNHHV